MRYVIRKKLMNSGFTLVEVLVTASIVIVMTAVLSTVYLATQNAYSRSATLSHIQQQARQGMERMARELSMSSLDQIISNTPCGVNECYGEKITFRVPVVTTDSNPPGVLEPTIFDNRFNIKWGADGNIDNTITFLVVKSPGTINDHQLVRRVPIVTPPEIGHCCPPLPDLTCSELTATACAAIGGAWWIANTTCSPTYCIRGACCNFITHACFPDIPPNDCQIAGGTYMGDSSLCAPNLCDAPPPPPPCFLKGTPILMANGKSMPIERVKIGDKIMSFDEETRKLVPDEVTKTFQHTADHYLIINHKLKVTPNHPVQSNGKWVEIGQLALGDSILNSHGKFETITSIKRVNKKVTVYNLEVNPYHTYIADGVVVHNKIDDPEPPPYGFNLIEFLEPSCAYAQVNATDTVLAADIDNLDFVIDNNNYPDTVETIIIAGKRVAANARLSFKLRSRILFKN